MAQTAQIEWDGIDFTMKIKNSFHPSYNYESEICLKAIFNKIDQKLILTSIFINLKIRQKIVQKWLKNCPKYGIW